MKKIDNQTKNEIEIFNKHLSLHLLNDMNKIWKAIIPCISGYLIEESYKKNEINRLINFIKNGEVQQKIEFEIINENEFIELERNWNWI